MHLARCRKFNFFMISFLGLLFLPKILLPFSPYYFAPFIIISYYQLSYVNCLWVSLLCGTLIDCLSVHSFFGLNASAYCLSTLLLFRYRVHFFADRPSTLPIMSALFSFVVTLLFLLSAIILESRELLSLHLIYADLIAMPLGDGLYAWLFFVVPFYLAKEFRRYYRKRYN